jgi:hypothetical protein
MMSNIVFNTAISSEDSPSFEHLANTCFTPVRYLFRGRTIEILDKKIVQERISFPQYDKTWIKTASAVAFLVPGILLGLVAKFLSYAFSSARSNFQITREFDLQPFTPPTLSDAEMQTSLEDSYRKLSPLYLAIIKKMGSKDIWKDDAFIKDVTVFMEESYKTMLIYFSQLSARHHGNPKKMAEVMIRQNFRSAEERKEDLTVYSYPYFYESLTDMYHIARSCPGLMPSPWEEGEQTFDFPSPLTEENQKPYFNPQNVQYRWRQLYNRFCQMLDDHQLRGYLNDRRSGDSRFVNWANPDVGYVEYFGFPGTKPS